MSLLWTVVHHCVAHPLLAIGEVGRWLHDWTGRHLEDDEEPETTEEKP